MWLKFLEKQCFSMLAKMHPNTSIKSSVDAEKQVDL